MKEILLYKRLISFGMELDEIEWYVKRNKGLWNCKQRRKSCSLLNKFKANCVRDWSTVEILRTEHTIMESRFAKTAIEEELPCTKLHPSVDRVTSCTAIILSNRHRIKHSYFTVKAPKYYKTSFKSGNSLGLTFNPAKNGKSMFSPSFPKTFCGATSTRH